MTNTQLLVIFENSVSKVKEAVANKDAVEARKHLADAVGNYMSDLYQDVIFEISQAVYALERQLSQVETVESYSVVETIMNQLHAKGYSSRQDDDNMITITADDYDVALTVLEDGYELETYCLKVGIAHFRTQEWSNYKKVKTLKGLNGYFRKFGIESVSI